jgi:hypothetical protein
MAEIKLRNELGLPRIELTPEERAREFGDLNWANRDPYAREQELAHRLQNGLPLSHSDKRTARQFLKGKV